MRDADMECKVASPSFHSMFRQVDHEEVPLTKHSVEHLILALKSHFHEAAPTAPSPQQRLMNAPTLMAFFNSKPTSIPVGISDEKGSGVITSPRRRESRFAPVVAHRFLESLERGVVTS